MLRSISSLLNKRILLPTSEYWIISDRTFGSNEIKINKERTREISLETSLKYMTSTAYDETYGDKKIWQLYRRNFARGKKNSETRKTCIREGTLITNNPCPICRDEYLIIDYRNIRLLKQFIKEYNGKILTSKESMVCQDKHYLLELAIEKSKLYGLIDSFDPNFVEYDYEKYKPQ